MKSILKEIFLNASKIVVLILLLIVLLYLFSTCNFTPKIMYEGEEEFFKKIEELSVGELPLDFFKSKITDEEGKDIFIFLENEKYILCFNNDLLLKNKETGKAAGVLSFRNEKYYNEENVLLDISFYDKDNVFHESSVSSSMLYNEVYVFSDEMNDDILESSSKIILNEDGSITILYIEYGFPAYHGDCIFITPEIYKKINHPDKEVFWIYLADDPNKLNEYTQAFKYIPLIKKPFYCMRFLSSGRGNSLRKEILRNNGIKFYEIRKIYRNLGIEEFYLKDFMGGIIIPITYKLTENGLEQYINKDDLYFSKIKEGTEPKLEYYYPIEKPDFLSDLIIK